MGRAIVLACIILVSCNGDDAPDQEVSAAEPSGRRDEAEPRDPAAEAVDDDDEAIIILEDGADDEVVLTATQDDDAVLVGTAGEEPRWINAPNRCERLQVRINEEGRRRHRRIRVPWTWDDQKRFSKLVGLVAREMDADPRLIRVWAMRESSHRPHAMHVLNPDIESALTAWRRYRYSAEEEAELQAKMASTTAQDPEFWKAKGRLRRVQTFRDNRYLDEMIEFEVITADGKKSWGSEPAWAFGYGPFGFNPGLFVPMWDSRSPPWVFCDEDGIIAIITAVWAARSAQRECDAQGFGDSYASVNRRFSSGHCGPVNPRSRFRKRARALGIDPDARAKLGRKWRRDRADRQELLRVMRSKAAEAGLLSGYGRAGA